MIVLGALLAVGVAASVWMREPDQPTAPTTPSSSTIRFEQVATLNNGTIDEKPVPDSTLGGVALFDYDNDGFLDIYFTNGARLPDLNKPDSSFFNRLYRNRGDRTFEDVTETAGVQAAGYSFGVAAADYDNDGWSDLYISGVNRNTLYRNRGDGTFADATQEASVAGKAAKPWSVAAAWLDYNVDGALDLFVVNYLDWSWQNNRVCGDPGRRLSCSPVLYGGLANTLYRNNGDGTFRNVSEAAGISQHIGKGMSAAIADYDDDGYPDIFVTNDSERNFLFHNLGGERFEEVGVQTGVAFNEDGIPVSSMGLDFRDLNNDGSSDVIITALANETYPLFLNRGDGSFVDSTYAAKIGLASVTMSGWGVGAFDFDNDGLKDIFTANSHVSENVDLYRHQLYRLPNAIFQNAGNATFRDVSAQAGPALKHAAAHRGAAFGDLDNDGAIDVVVSAIGSEAKVLFNIAPQQHWLLLQLEGTAGNRDALGARIKLTGESGRVQYNHATTAVSYASSSDKRVHFGLGADAVATEIEIRWPNSGSQLLKDIPADQILKVVEETTIRP